jgi:hypothetical protein
MANKKLSRLLLVERLRATILTVPAVLVLGFVFAAYNLNGAGSSTIENGIVIRSKGNPDKYQATDTIVFVELADGRMINLHLIAGAVPPAPNTQLKIGRVKRILFGEYFMLAQ